jgi:hypothetical protein
MPFVKFSVKPSDNSLSWENHYEKIRYLSTMNRKKISANTYTWMIYQRIRQKKKR